jgi:hypothetical protein
MKIRAGEEIWELERKNLVGAGPIIDEPALYN